MPLESPDLSVYGGTLFPLPLKRHYREKKRQGQRKQEEQVDITSLLFWVKFEIAKHYHLGTEDDLYLWRRSIAEINNLNSYRAFFTETEGEMKRKKPTRQTGETNNQKAHKEYLAYIYADRSPGTSTNWTPMVNPS
jgi:hypothetical protein